MLAMWRLGKLAIVLGALCGTIPALAADVVLLPDPVAGAGVTEAEAEAIWLLVAEVMNDNEFVVITEPVLERVMGPVLRDCRATSSPEACASIALTSLPARLAVLLTMRSEGERLMLEVSFVGQETASPVQQMAVPVEMGKQRRVALQVTMFSLDVAEEEGQLPPAMVEAARRMVDASRPAPPDPVRVPPVDDLFGFDEDEELLADEDLMDETPQREPEEDERLPVPGAPRDDVPSRLYAGSERPFAARRGTGDQWLKEKRAHAGRVILEVRGSAGIGGLSRIATVLGEPSATNGELESTFIQEAPRYEVLGRAELYIGYAPATMVDIGVLVGVNFARDFVTVGYMQQGQEPLLGEPEELFVVRPYLQPRLRLYLVPLGVAKPYVVLGGEMIFVSTWDFDVTTAEAFPRPSGGVMAGLLGGGGISFDPVPRVGVVIEATASRYLGDISGVRFEGTVVGVVPDPLPGVQRWSVGVGAGLQFRL